MIFLYTNSAESGGIQTVARLSIGGFVSGSIVPNDVLNEVFSDISMNTESNNQYRLLALKNTLSYTADNITVKVYLSEDIISQLEMAFVLPALDKCGDYVFEKTANQYAKPFNADFTVLSDGIVLNIGSLGSGEALGVWIVRKFDISSNSTKSCEELYEDYVNEIPTEKEDNIQVDISWDEQESVSASASASI